MFNVKIQNMLNEYYNLCSYQWNLKLKNQLPINGFFVFFEIKNEETSVSYPRGNMAFCPTKNYQEFNSNIECLNEIPNYITFFSKNDIESICGVIPFHI